MKNTILSILAIFAISFAVISCNSSPKLMTEAQIDKRIEQLTAMEIDSLDIVLDRECNRRMSAMVAAKRDSIIAVSQEN